MMLLILFLTFLKIGAFTFGGGYAMIPLIQAEVQSHGWLSAEELVNFVAIAESTPGPIAVNMATFVGTRMAGIPGAICATVGVVLPSYIIILIVAKCFQKFKSSRVVSGCMSGLRPAVVGLIGSAVISVGKTVFFPAGIFFGTTFFISLAIFAVCAVLAFKKKHPIAVICISAVLGIAAGYIFGL
jgi:chromate transporter